MKMQRLQEAVFGEDTDYRVGSPHLAHWQLRDRLVALLRQVVRDLERREMPLTVLEVGAGHGGYTEAALAAGCWVTATEMSRPSLAILRDHFGTNERFSTIFDRDGSLTAVGVDKFSLILCSSVLHHIPDYLTFVRQTCSRHLTPGGSFLSIQDPLWYPALGTATRTFSRAAYLAWRATRGDYRKGARTLARRARRVYDDEDPSDTVEYHVVRKGVNEHAVVDALRPSFETVILTRYWSTQGRAWQRLGELANLENTFAVEAHGFALPASPGDVGHVD